MNVHSNVKVCLASFCLEPTTMQRMRMTIKRNALMMAAYVNVRYLPVLQEYVNLTVIEAIDCTNTSQKVIKINSLMYPNCFYKIHIINKYLVTSTAIVWSILQIQRPLQIQ